MTDEAALLEAIRQNPDDNTPRLVYADWLDDHNRPGGEFLRLECELHELAPTDVRREELHFQLREASVGVDTFWLSTVSRAAIENCRVRFQFRCPKKWEQLRVPRTVQMYGDADVRYCTECEKNVYFCENIEQAHQHAKQGDCVALDPRLSRHPEDLGSDYDAPLTAPEYEGEIVTMGLLVDTRSWPEESEVPPRRWWQFWRRS